MKDTNPELGQDRSVFVSPRYSCRPLTVDCPYSVNGAAIAQQRIALFQALCGQAVMDDAVAVGGLRMYVQTEDSWSAREYDGVVRCGDCCPGYGGHCWVVLGCRFYAIWVGCTRHLGRLVAVVFGVG